MKQLLENLIKEWWVRPLPNIIEREVDLKDYLDLRIKKIISVIGFRRSGKTFILLDLAKKVGQQNCVYLNLEDERLPHDVKILTLLIEVLTELSGNKPYLLLLDEIQNIPNWSLWARRIHESTNHKLFISGSSSKLSSFELPTELRGRSLSLKVAPLSFKEFLKFKNVEAGRLPKPHLLYLVREYLTYGGFPEIVLVEEGKKPLILDEYFQTFLTRDVMERHKLRNDAVLKTLIQLLLNSPYYTITKLANNLSDIGKKVSKTTVQRYLEFLKESFFVADLTLHTPNIKNRLKAERKPYFVDSYFLSRYSKFSANYGRLMEAIVFNHLQAKIENDPRKEIYYWKDYQNHEVDFVVRAQEEVKELIQVSFVSSKEEIQKRESKSLLKASRELKCANLLLITWDFEGEVEVGKAKIKALPFYRSLFGQV